MLQIFKTWKVAGCDVHGLVYLAVSSGTSAQTQFNATVTYSVVPLLLLSVQQYIVKKKW